MLTAIAAALCCVWVQASRRACRCTPRSTRCRFSTSAPATTFGLCLVCQQPRQRRWCRSLRTGAGARAATVRCLHVHAHLHAPCIHGKHVQACCIVPSRHVIPSTTHSSCRAAGPAATPALQQPRPDVAGQLTHRALKQLFDKALPERAALHSLASLATLPEGWADACGRDPQEWVTSYVAVILKVRLGSAGQQPQPQWVLGVCMP